MRHVDCGSGHGEEYPVRSDNTVPDLLLDRVVLRRGGKPEWEVTEFEKRRLDPSQPAVCISCGMRVLRGVARVAGDVGQSGWLGDDAIHYSTAARIPSCPRSCSKPFSAGTPSPHRMGSRPSRMPATASTPGQAGV